MTETSPAVAGAAPVPGWGRRFLGSEYAVLLLSAATVVVLAPLLPGWLSSENASNLVAGMLPLLVVAVGQTLVLITAGIDLSVTATIGLASVAGAFVMNGETGWLGGSALATPAGILVMLAVGAGVGAVNGAAVAALRLPAFIVTLTTQMFVGGLSVWLVQSKSISGLPAAFTAVGARTELSLSVALAVAAAAHVTLNRTLGGRWLYAVGHNPRAAALSGVPVARVTALAYVASGLCGAVAAILYTGGLQAASPVHGQRILLDVIGATVIGGTSLFGGRGKVTGTVFGVLFLALLDNGLNWLSLSDFTIKMVKGGVILASALLDTIRHRLLHS
jgi:ribose/xylose/arabinose/galactoside ABC-type transport system permease subunit